LKNKEYSDEYLSTCRQALEREKNKSLSETNTWEHVDREKVHSDWNELFTELAKLIDHSSPSDDAVQAIIAQHYHITCRFYRPSKRAYIGTSLFLNENKEFLDYHNRYHPQLANFLGVAMRYYAENSIAAI
jgi:hypothetical protein